MNPVNKLFETASIDELNEIIAGEKALMVYFFNDGCSPCLALRPKIQSMISEMFPNMKLVFVDSMKYPDIAANFKAFSNPVLLVFFEGKEYVRKSQFISISELQSIISRNYEMLFEETD